MAFSNRCFLTKISGKWMRLNDEQRRKWIGGYFWASGGWKDVEEMVWEGEHFWRSGSSGSRSTLYEPPKSDQAPATTKLINRPETNTH